MIEVEIKQYNTKSANQQNAKRGCGSQLTRSSLPHMALHLSRRTWTGLRRPRVGSSMAGWHLVGCCCHMVALVHRDWGCCGRLVLFQWLCRVMHADLACACGSCPLRSTVGGRGISKAWGNWAERAFTWSQGCCRIAWVRQMSDGGGCTVGGWRSRAEVAWSRKFTTHVAWRDNL